MNATLPPPDTSSFLPPRAPSAEPKPQRLVRPRNHRRIAGVCAAFANRFDLDVTLVRVLTVLSVILPGPQVLAYLIAWLVIPNED